MAIEEVVRPFLRLGPYHDAIFNEAERITGYGKTSYLKKDRSEPLASYRNALIRAVYERTAMYDKPALCRVFNRERTAISYSSGCLKDKPNYSRSFYHKIARFIDGLGAEVVVNKRKLKISEKMLAHLDRARIALRMKEASRGSHFTTPEKRAKAAAFGTKNCKAFQHKARLVKAANRRVPDRGEPLVRQLLSIIRRERLEFTGLSELSGVSEKTMSDWGTGRKGPRLANIVAVYGALGYDLVPLPREHLKKE